MQEERAEIFFFSGGQVQRFNADRTSSRIGRTVDRHAFFLIVK
jgi:hypothetical protein